MRHATRRTLLLVGPDGAGKSAVLDEIVAQASSRGVTVRHVHSRPGILGGRPSSGPVTDPHAKPPRPLPAAAAKLLMVFGDNVLGHLRDSLRRADGLIVVERGWYDMVVDQRRYRLPARLGRAAEVLGRLLPRADVVVLLSADPAVIVARKAELEPTEIQRQIDRWIELLPRAGKRSIELDTGSESPALCAERIGGALATAGWRHVRPAPARLDLRATGHPRSALDVYRPQHRRAKFAGAVTRINGRIGIGAASSPPFEHLDELLEQMGLDASGVVAMRSSTRDRWVLSVDTARGGAILKVGRPDDGALRNEAQFLSSLVGSPLRVPALLWCGGFRSHFVVATARVESAGAAVTLDEVGTMCTAMVRGDVGGAPLVHGDLAAWNILRDASGPVVIDWEFAQRRRSPLWDLAHHVIQGGALVGVRSPAESLALLVTPDSPGWRHLADVGESGADAGRFLQRYLEAAEPHEDRARTYLEEVHRLNARRPT